VAKAYNAVFLTDAAGGVPYDEASQEGLSALIADHGSSEQQTNWDATAWHSATSIQNALTDVTTVSVLIAETSSQHTFGVKVGTTFIPIYTTGTWTPPSRGWINDPMGTLVTDPVSGQVVSDWSTGVVSIPDLLISEHLPADSAFTFYVASSPDNPPSSYIPLDNVNTHRIESNGTYNSGFLLAYEDGSDMDFNDLVVYVNGPSSAPGGCMGHKPTILGTPNADLQIRGTLGNDVIMTFGGTDIVRASLGDDIICTGAGDDMVFAGGGNDVIYDNLGRNMIFGNAGDDTIYGGTGKDAIYGGAGDDIIYGGGGNDVIYGDAGNDTIFAGAGNDVAIAMSGNDEIHGGDGNDRIFGANGNDALYGDAGDDRIYGSRGTNTIDGGTGINYCAPPLPGDASVFSNCQ
jgi:Ca2+-binding RTX toxin-like protein